MSKGSKRRPALVKTKQFEDNWDKTFGNKKDKKDVKQNTVDNSGNSTTN